MQYDKQHFFDNTNGGLDYILKEFPSGRGFENRKNFKIDSADSSPSGRIESKRGIYYYTDYRESTKGYNAIDLCMKLKGLEFPEAMKYLYAEMNLQTLDGKNSVSAKWEIKDTHLDIEHWNVEYEEKPQNLSVFAPFLTPAHCEPFNFKSIKSYEFVSYVKDKKTGQLTEKKQLNKVYATDQYPIFGFVEEGFVKRYEPRAKKEYRFSFFGKRPHYFVHGMEFLKSLADTESITRLRNKIKLSDKEKDKKAYQEELDELLLDPVIIASGGSDGLNLASLGFLVIWLNSENDYLSREDYEWLKLVSKGVYYMPDLDVPGKEHAKKLGLKFLDLKKIWLPMDYERTGRKDFRDWVTLHKDRNQDKEKVKKWMVYKIERMMENAVCFKWWRWNTTGSNYKYSYPNLMYFLASQGFYKNLIQYKNQERGKLEYTYVKIDGIVAREIHHSDVKEYLDKWCQENDVSINVREMVLGSRGINTEHLSSLPACEIDWKSSTDNSQAFLFKNKGVRITANGIEFFIPEKENIRVWNSRIIQHHIKLDERPQFTITKNEQGHWDVTINEKENKFLNYVINTCRMYWRKELEEPFGSDYVAKEAYHAKHLFDLQGENLTYEEIKEQKQHFVNKIFAFGYLLHRYKNKSKAWAVVALDNKIPDTVGESHGGSGKSLGAGTVVELMTNRVFMDGRDEKLLDDRFMFEEITYETDVVFYDDVHYSFPYKSLFSKITGSMKIDKKYLGKFELDFYEAPKILLTTNYLPQDLDPSTMRRILLMVYSDYYHKKVGDNYLETRSPATELGGEILVKGSPEKDFNLFYNFCFQCVQFYLSCNEVVEAPVGNLEKRNAMQVMGDNFKEWANEFFLTDDDGYSPNLNCYLDRIPTLQNYQNFAKSKSKTSANFKKSLIEYCKIQGWEFNPPGLVGKDGRIKRKVVDSTTGKVTNVECFYINATTNVISKEGNTIVSRSPNGDQVTVQQPQLPLNHEPPNMYDEIFRPEEGTGIDSINENEF